MKLDIEAVKRKPGEPIPESYQDVYEAAKRILARWGGERGNMVNPLALIVAAELMRRVAVQQSEMRLGSANVALFLANMEVDLGALEKSVIS